MSCEKFPNENMHQKPQAYNQICNKKGNCTCTNSINKSKASYKTVCLGKNKIKFHSIQDCIFNFFRNIYPTKKGKKRKLDFPMKPTRTCETLGQRSTKTLVLKHKNEVNGKQKSTKTSLFSYKLMTFQTCRI